MLVSAVLGAGVLVGGCGESPYEIFVKGLEIEGEAERGACKLQFSDQVQAHTISGDQVAWCLKELEKALVYYDQAAAKGYEDENFKRVHARALERKQRLESMLKAVRGMEREQLGLDGEKPH